MDRRHEEIELSPHTIMLALFETKDGAHDALGALKRIRSERDLHIDDAAVLRRGANGRVRISETSDWSGRKGMVVGGVAGAAIGVLTGGVGWLALGGAAAAGLTSRLRDSGFDNEALQALASQLDVDSSALLAVCADDVAQLCIDTMRDAGCVDQVVYRLNVDETKDLTIVDVLEIVEPEQANA